MATQWAGLAETTIDHGVLEHAAQVAVVPAEIGWSDIGDWHALGELIETDERQNSVRGQVITIETRNSFVWSETGRYVALVGMDNVVVVDTSDALLVANRSQAQHVKDVVGRLKDLAQDALT